MSRQFRTLEMCLVSLKYNASQKYKIIQKISAGSAMRAKVKQYGDYTGSANITLSIKQHQVLKFSFYIIHSCADLWIYKEIFNQLHFSNSETILSWGVLLFIPPFQNTPLPFSPPLPLSPPPLTSLLSNSPPSPPATPPAISTVWLFQTTYIQFHLKNSMAF